MTEGEQNKAIKFKDLPTGNYFEFFNEQYNPPNVYKKMQEGGTSEMRYNCDPRRWSGPHRWIVEVKK